MNHHCCILVKLNPHFRVKCEQLFASVWITATGVLYPPSPMLVGSHRPWSHNARHQCCLRSPLQSLPHWRMASSCLRTSDHPPARIYQATNERFVVRADVLQAGEKGGLTHGFEHVWPRPNCKGKATSQQNCSPSGVFPVYNGQSLSHAVYWLWRQVMGSDGSLMPMRTKGSPSWSDPTDKLSCLKQLEMQKRLLMERFQGTHVIW